MQNCGEASARRAVDAMFEIVCPKGVGDLRHNYRYTRKVSKPFRMLFVAQYRAELRMRAVQGLAESHACATSRAPSAKAFQVRLRPARIACAQPRDKARQSRRVIRCLSVCEHLSRKCEVEDRLKGGRIISVQRPPTAYLLPVAARTVIRHFRLRASFQQNNITRWDGGNKT